MLTVAQLAELINGVWHGNAEHAIFSCASLLRANSNDVACLTHDQLKFQLATTDAGVVLVKAEHAHLCRGTYIIVAEPGLALETLAKILTPDPKTLPQIHPTALIHPTAVIASNASIAAYAVINERVRLAEHVVIAAHTVVDPDVFVGAHSHIGTGVHIHSGSEIGQHVVINPGCIIGSTPFNYVKEHGHWHAGSSMGGVILSDGVHLGANTVIDRGAIGDTCLGAGVCVDNLVHIAHDVFIGAHTAIAGCAAIGAFTVIGADCIIGGASSIGASIHIADNVVITATSSVSKSINKAGIYTSGTLAHEHSRWRRNAARFRRLDDYIIRLNALEQKIQQDN